MDTITLGAALAMTRGDITGAAQTAAEAKATAENALSLLEALGITLVDGKICQKIEKE